ncbi:MFS transporter [uncultured Pseudokineococcus sp.]|uniref:MFS transporter n=1 Tax=uncultured Pseudokineococcus sp. TaxID=1642928 RepID=UPI002621BE88|nr:MFS transporter [uncultured Pseudokineococcus sp.]
MTSGSPGRTSGTTDAVAPAQVARLVGAALVFGLVMAGATLPTALYGRYQEELGFGPLVQTTLFASYAVGVLVALVVLGELSDRVGRRPLLLLGIGAAALSGVCFLVADGLALLFAGRLLSGLSAGIFTGTATAAVVEVAPRPWSRAATSAATAVNVLGLGLGPVASAVVAEASLAPLRAPYLVHLLLLVPAALVTWWQPETAGSQRPAGSARGRAPVAAWRPHLLRPSVPPPVRRAFVPAATAGFAGFAVFGLFTAVAPRLVVEGLGVRDVVVANALVGLPFLASVVAQVATGPVSARRALPSGSAVLAVGAALLVAGLATEHLAVFVTAAVLLGLGHGTAFRAGVASVRAAAPPGQTGEVVSTLFVVLYVAISLPVVAVGALALATDLSTAAEVLGAAVGLLAVAALLVLRRRPLEE